MLDHDEDHAEEDDESQAPTGPPICPLCEKPVFKENIILPIVFGTDTSSVIVYLHHRCHAAATPEHVEEVITRMRYDCLLREHDDDELHDC